MNKEVSVKITSAQHERIYDMYLYHHPEYSQWARVEGSRLFINEDHVEDITWACEGIITANMGGETELAELNAARGLLRRIRELNK